MTGSVDGDCQDRHVGDLGNIEFGELLEAEVSIQDHLVKLGGDTSVIGRAIVVHEGGPRVVEDQSSSMMQARMIWAEEVMRTVSPRGTRGPGPPAA